MYKKVKMLKKDLTANKPKSSLHQRYDLKPLKSLDSPPKPFRISRQNFRSLTKHEPSNLPSHTFSVAKGNNSRLVSSVLESEDWHPAPRKSVASLLWVQDSQKLNFSELAKNRVKVNAFECHWQLTNKEYLYANLKQYCLEKGIDLSTIMPVTFAINFSKPAGLIKQSMTAFLEYFLSNHPRLQHLKIKGSFHITRQSRDIKIKYKDLNLTPGPVTPLLPESPSSSSSQSKYIWLLKPSDKNRGTGIKLFTKIKWLQQELSTDECTRLNMYIQSEEQSSFVVQKYIEDPMLISGRKFDVRMWSLVDTKGCLYIFKEGYLRLSGYPFSLSPASLDNIYVHLTNNAIQKTSPSYSTQQEGNQLSFSEFSSYLKQNHPETNLAFITTQFYSLIRHSHEATKHLLNPKNRRNCFQIFGYDFLITQKSKVWLLEVNCNPCLEESSEVVRGLVNKLLRETVKVIEGGWGRGAGQETYFQRVGL